MAADGIYQNSSRYMVDTVAAVMFDWSEISDPSGRGPEGLTERVQDLDVKFNPPSVLPIPHPFINPLARLMHFALNSLLLIPRMLPK